MPRSTLLSQAIQDVADDVVYHAVNIAHGVFELICLTAVGLVVYASSIDPANAGLGGRALFGVQAAIEVNPGSAVNASHAPTSCGLTNDLLASDHRSCITAMMLEPLGT